MKTVIEMAREADLIDDTSASDWYVYQLKRFAELVRADAIAEEREACAQEVENYALGYAEPVWAFKLSSIIRARSNT